MNYYLLLAWVLSLLSKFSSKQEAEFSAIVPLNISPGVVVSRLYEVSPLKVPICTAGFTRAVVARLEIFKTVLNTARKWVENWEKKKVGLGKRMVSETWRVWILMVQCNFNINVFLGMIDIKIVSLSLGCSCEHRKPWFKSLIWTKWRNYFNPT